MPMRRVYILPNLFTAGNLFCGLLAVFEALDFNDGDVIRACILVLWAAAFDVMDGVVARLTHSESDFGLNFDSLADVTSFGVAPAAIVFAAVSPVFPLLAKGTCGLYVLCGAMRLARFNVQAAREEKKVFLGLPIPAAGCAAVCLFWVLTVRVPADVAFPFEKLLPPILVLLAYLMVSEIRYYGLKSIRLGKRQPFGILVSLGVVIALLVVLKDHLDLILLLIFGLYPLSGPLLRLSRIMRRRQSTPAEAAEGGGEESMPGGPPTS